MSIEVALVTTCKCAPEIVSAILFFAHRRYPDYRLANALATSWGVALPVSPGPNALLADLIGFHQTRKDFDAALTMCLLGYCVLVALRPVPSAAFGMMAWLVGKIVAEVCFPGDDARSRHRLWVAMPFLFGVVEVMSVGAKVVWVR